MKKIGILTSGGDSQGMNAFLEVFCSKAKNCEILGFLSGFDGLIDKNYYILKEIDGIFNLGGSVLKTGRSLRFLTKKGFEKAINNYMELGLDCLIVLGGNGSLNGAKKLVEKGVNVIGIPASIDNDLTFSSHSLGFDTAVNNCVDSIEKIKDTMRANDRAVIVETMGRECGDIALNSAVAVKADLLAIKEIPSSIKNLETNFKQLLKQGILSPVVIVAEKILDTKSFAEKLTKETGKDVRWSILGYLQRGGAPSVFDKVFASSLATKTAQLIEQNNLCTLVGMSNNEIITVDYKEMNSVKNKFNNELYNLMFKE